MIPEEIDKSLPEYLADLIVAVRDKARTQALEEAAKVVEKMLDGNGYAEAVAAAIHALKDKS